MEEFPPNKINQTLNHPKVSSYKQKHIYDNETKKTHEEFNMINNEIKV